MRPFLYSVKHCLRILNKMSTAKKMKAKSRNFLGGYVPAPLAQAVDQWVGGDPERDRSVFLRQAAREKLQRDGIQFDERVTAESI